MKNTKYIIKLNSAETDIVIRSLVDLRNSMIEQGRYIDSVKNNYDYVLLDCRPSLGMLVINALSASDYVLILQGLPQRTGRLLY